MTLINVEKLRVSLGHLAEKSQSTKKNHGREDDARKRKRGHQQTSDGAEQQINQPSVAAEHQIRSVAGLKKRGGMQLLHDDSMSKTGKFKNLPAHNGAGRLKLCRGQSNEDC